MTNGTAQGEVRPAASQNALGIGLMTLSMALLASADAGIKVLSERYSQPVLLMIMGLGIALVFEIAARRRGQSLFDRRAFTRVALLRSFAEAAAGASMVLALALVPFTIITMVMQAMPLLVTLGAVVFFGEQVGWRRWSAIAVGLAGVLLILRPGGEGFSATWLIALGSATAIAMRDLASRAVHRTIPTVLISGWGGLAVLATGLVLFIAEGAPLPQAQAWDVPWFVMIDCLFAGGIFAVSAAMRMGEVAVVAPFRYTRLPFGLAIGVAVFGEALDAMSLLGVGIIVASGLYVFFREHGSASA